MKQVNTELKLSRIVIKAPGINKTDEMEDDVTARHTGVRGYSQEKMEQAEVLCIGAGGLGGGVGNGLARKGVGTLKIIDGDIVELTNLNRQEFHEDDLFKNKAIQLSKNLMKPAVRPTTFIAYPFMFEEVLERNLDMTCNVVYCGVDNNKARIAATQFCLERKIPLVMSGVSLDADHGYVFVQEPGKACFACFLPSALEDRKSPCPDTPATNDILKTLAGLSLYAIDSILMERVRKWNYRHVYLPGVPPDSCCVIEQKDDCKLCSQKNKEVQHADI
jgi:molybdopterin-synthase adenylyltransferase